MKTTIQNLAVLILLISTMNVYSQEYALMELERIVVVQLQVLLSKRFGMQFMEYRLIRRGKQYYRLVIFQ